MACAWEAFVREASEQGAQWVVFAESYEWLYLLRGCRAIGMRGASGIRFARWWARLPIGGAAR